MKCLNCGHCCINYEVIIVDNPKLGIVGENLIAKHTGEKCPHLQGEIPGNYSCKIHNEKWYKKTPCFQFTQIEQNINSICRVGDYLMNRIG